MKEVFPSPYPSLFKNFKKRIEKIKKTIDKTEKSWYNDCCRVFVGFLSASIAAYVSES